MSYHVDFVEHRKTRLFERLRECQSTLIGENKVDIDRRDEPLQFVQIRVLNSVGKGLTSSVRSQIKSHMHGPMHFAKTIIREVLLCSVTQDFTEWTQQWR